MTTRIMARVRPGAALPPVWTSVLAVIAHPDDASSGLGAVLDAFVFAGTRVKMLCLTHGHVWTLEEAPGDLTILRGAELASAVDVLGPNTTSRKMAGHPDGALGNLSQSTLATEVVAAADSCHPDGLLVFDVPVVTGHLEHLAATAAGLRAAETLDLPVLGWTLSKTATAHLKREFGTGFTAHPQEQVDLRVTLERARLRLASRADARQAVPGSVHCRRLEMLAETGCLRWLRPPGMPASARTPKQARARQTAEV